MYASSSLQAAGARARRRESAGGDERSGRRAAVWAAILALLAVVALLVAWFAGWLRFGTDPRVAEILALQEEARVAFTAGGGPSSVAEAGAAFAAMGRIREKVEALPPHLRPQVERSGGSMFRNAMRARIDSYFSAPPEQRRAELDRHIDQEEMLRKASELARAVTGGGERGSGNDRAGESASGGRGAGGGGTSPARSDESRSNWRKRIIDRTTPEQRARYVEYRRAMEQRRGERGLPAGSGGR
jgi:hypothetical protein